MVYSDAKYTAAKKAKTINQHQRGIKMSPEQHFGKAFVKLLNYLCGGPENNYQFDLKKIRVSELEVMGRYLLDTPLSEKFYIVPDEISKILYNAMYFSVTLESKRVASDTVIGVNEVAHTRALQSTGGTTMNYAAESAITHRVNVEFEKKPELAGIKYFPSVETERDNRKSQLEKLNIFKIFILPVATGLHANSGPITHIVTQIVVDVLNDLNSRGVVIQGIKNDCQEKFLQYYDEYKKTYDNSSVGEMADIFQNSILFLTQLGVLDLQNTKENTIRGYLKKCANSYPLIFVLDTKTEQFDGPLSGGSSRMQIKRIVDPTYLQAITIKKQADEKNNLLTANSLGEQKKRDLEKDLRAAAGRGKLSRVKELIAAGVNINAQAADGSTALIMAVSYGHLQVAKELMTYKDIDLYIENNKGMCALSFAQKQNNAEIIKLLTQSTVALTAKKKIEASMTTALSTFGLVSSPNNNEQPYAAKITDIVVDYCLPRSVL